jgi:hypothetical protein
MHLLEVVIHNLMKMDGKHSIKFTKVVIYIGKNSSLKVDLAQILKIFIVKRAWQ